MGQIWNERRCIVTEIQKWAAFKARTPVGPGAGRCQIIQLKFVPILSDGLSNVVSTTSASNILGSQKPILSTGQIWIKHI